MHVWKFDRDRCDFLPAHETAIDPDGTYLVSDGDQLILNDRGELRPISRDETLIAVAGQSFPRAHFECYALPDAYVRAREQEAGKVVPLDDEMRRDGMAMQHWLRARTSINRWVTDQMLPLAEGPWSYISGRWIGDGRYSEATLHFEPCHWLPVLELRGGLWSPTKPLQLQGSLRGTWKGDRLANHRCVMGGTRVGVDGGESVELGAWWTQFVPWLDLPRSCDSFFPLDVD